MYDSTDVTTSTVRSVWRMFLFSLGVSLLCLPLVNAQDLEVDIAPAASREVINYDEDVIDGAFYFRLMCWNCHAAQTRGGKAPDLFKPQWLYGWTDDGIFQTVFNGLPGTEMQKFGGKLSDEAITMIVGYLRTEQAKAAGVALDEVKPTQDWTPYMEGDVKAGEAIFFSEGYACGKCHTVHGRGATGTGNEIGPDMTHVARTRSRNSSSSRSSTRAPTSRPNMKWLPFLRRMGRKSRVGSVISMITETD